MNNKQLLITVRKFRRRLACRITKLLLTFTLRLNDLICRLITGQAIEENLQEHHTSVNDYVTRHIGTKATSFIGQDVTPDL